MEDQKLILSSVRALWGCVMPSLRTVSIELNDDIILWKCVFDSTATEDDLENLSAAAAEVTADFPKYGLKEIIVTIPFPQKTEPLKNLIYLRKE